MKRIGPIATITALNLVLTSATLAVSSSAALASADVGVGVGDRVSDVLASPTNALRATRATNWNGGAFVTPGGQRLTIYVHPRYNYAREEVQSNANWLASYLYFGPELSRATFLLIPPEYIAQYCGASTYGCYEPSSASLYVPWNSFPDGTHWMTVIAHEYGHHVASSRTNPPWLAGTWGPKRWASYVNVCARVAGGTAFPGGRGGLYWSNPGEVFAETYARAVNRVGGWLNNWWPVWSWSYDPTFAADPGSIDFARQDAVSPYGSGWSDQWTGRLVRKAIRVRHNGRWRLERRGPVLPVVTDVATQLDGDFHAVLDVSPGATLVAVDPASGGPIATGAALSLTVCGQRTIRLRIVAPRPGPFAVTITRP